MRGGSHPDRATLEPAPPMRWAALLHMHPAIPIFLLALTLRVVYFVQGLDNPLLHLPILDEAYYVELGRAIAGGHWLGENRAFFMDPLYGYVLALFFLVFGDDLLPVRIFQILLDSLTAVLVYHLAAALWGRRAGVVSGVLYAVYKVAFFYPLLILKTTLSTGALLLFTLGALHVSRSRRAVHWFFLGTAGGALVHLQAGWGLMLPLTAVFYWLVERPGLYRWANHAALFAAGAVLILSAGAVRNYAATGQWIWLNTQSGRLLYSSNNPENLSGRYGVPSFSRLHPEESEADFHREAENRVGGRLTPIEVSAYWRKKTLDFLTANPMAALTLVKNKIKETLADYEIPNNHSFYLAARFSELAQWPLPGFALILGLGVPGLVLGLAANRRAGWLLPALLSVVTTIVLFYTSSRFRMPAVPLLIIAAGGAVERLLHWIKKKEGLKIIVLLTISASLFFSSLALSDHRESGTEEFFLAKAYWSLSSHKAAEEEALRGAKRFPDQARFPAMLGMVALSESRYADAVRYSMAALEIEPGHADAHHNAGLAYLLMGRPQDAVHAVERALALQPNGRYFYTLAKANEALGRGEEALRLYAEYLMRSKPSDPFRKDAEDSMASLKGARTEP